MIRAAVLCIGLRLYVALMTLPALRQPRPREES